jgi:NADH dehydrogenase/NADH:ubiquinone oxidoreductase subunit G
MRPRSCSRAGVDLLEGRQTGLDYDVVEPRAVRVQLDHRRHRDADAILLVGTNPRWEAPLVNTRVRKAVRAGAKVFAIGPEVDLGLSGRMARRRSEAARQAAQGGEATRSRAPSGRR